MADTITCGVCNQDPSKYKCPHCELRYCSIPCFKDHIAEHEAAEQSQQAEIQVIPTHTSSEQKREDEQEDDPVSSPFEIEKSPVPEEQIPEPPSSTTANPVDVLLANPSLQQLLIKHPDLKPTLRKIYRATLHPHTQLETRLDDHDIGEEDEDALARRWGGSDMKRWTREKADERALAMLLELQMRDEGVAEFSELARRALGGGNGGEKNEIGLQDAMAVQT